jgi:hypothetical protein
LFCWIRRSPSSRKRTGSARQAHTSVVTLASTTRCQQRKFRESYIHLLCNGRRDDRAVISASDLPISFVIPNLAVIIFYTRRMWTSACPYAICVDGARRDAEEEHLDGNRHRCDVSFCHVMKCRERDNCSFTCQKGAVYSSPAADTVQTGPCMNDSLSVRDVLQTKL